MFSQLTYPVGNSCGICGYVDSCVLLLTCSVEPWCLFCSLLRFFAAFGTLPTRYGFPSGNSLTAPIDASATVTPVSATVSPPRPIVRVCGLRVCGFCRPLMRRRPSLLFRLALSTPNADMFLFPGLLCPGLFCRTMRRRAVAAVSAACLPGLLVCTILGHSYFCQLPTPRLHMQLRVVTTAVAACLAGLRTTILTLRRAGAYYWRPSAWAFTLPCAEADAAHMACAFCSFYWCGL